MNSISQIKIGKHKVGIVGLGRVIEELSGEPGHRSDREIAEVRSKNSQRKIMFRLEILFFTRRHSFANIKRLPERSVLKRSGTALKLKFLGKDARDATRLSRR